MHEAIRDLEVFFQIIMQSVYEGFSWRVPQDNLNFLSELKEFRELKENKENILVVDDEEMTRRVCRDILEYQGHRAILAADGQQALEILSEKAQEVSLVILDLVLPGMSGQEVYSRIKERYPALSVLIASGYPIEQAAKKILAGESVAYIGKPFATEDFLEKVELLLDGAKDQAVQ